MKTFPDSVLVVEPGLHQPFGHMRGELELFLSGLRANKVPFQVVGSRSPASPVPEDWNLALPSAFWIQFCESLPPTLGIRLIEFLTYRLALRLSAQSGSPVIGLTSSGPFGLALAAISRPIAEKVLFMVYHLGSVEKRFSLWRLSYQPLLSRGVNIGTYASTVQSRLQNIFPCFRGLVYFLPTLAAVKLLKRRGSRRKPVLVVSGLDSEGRRSPIRHLRLLGNLRFPKLILHDPTGRFEGCRALEKNFSSAVKVEKVSDYFTDDYSTFLSKGTAVFIAYDPHFQNPSSVLRHAVCAGVPVISSRFPDFKFLEDKFGLLGEAWEYDNPQSLDAAIKRFFKWTEREKLKFALASDRLRKYLAPPQAVREHLRVFHRCAARDIKV